MAGIKSANDVGGSCGKNTGTLAATGILVQAGPSLFIGFSLRNATGAIAYLQCFNAVQLSDVTLGTTTPVFSVPVNFLASASIVDHCLLQIPVNQFPLGLCVYSTTTATGNTGANVDGVVYYA
jgi:hypothetical protein